MENKSKRKNNNIIVKMRKNEIKLSSLFAILTDRMLCKWINLGFNGWYYT